MGALAAPRQLPGWQYAGVSQTRVMLPEGLKCLLALVKRPNWSFWLLQLAPVPRVWARTWWPAASQEPLSCSLDLFLSSQASRQFLLRPLPVPCQDLSWTVEFRSKASVGRSRAGFQPCQEPVFLGPASLTMETALGGLGIIQDGNFNCSLNPAPLSAPKSHHSSAPGL